jgi:tRNA pseudouridine38-40 synthase
VYFLKEKPARHSERFSSITILQRMRYFFEIAYNGKNYNGWQSQRNALGIQSVVEEVLSTIYRERIQIVCSGRTDTGVHCEQQFFHADVQQEVQEDRDLLRLNSFLPKDISIQSIRLVKPTSSARYDAVERTYQYRIVRKKDPFSDGLAWHYFKPMDLELMNKAAGLLLGEHDFECFSKVKTDVNHFRCTVKKAAWKGTGEGTGDQVEFTITANRFLRGMVRAVVGTLLDVGSGKTSIKDFQHIIASRDRTKAGANVPPYGLYLVAVKYPPGIFVKS